MTVKKTTQVGNPVIRTKAKQVKRQDSAKTKKVIQNLIDSMREHNLVGMAAPQIGESLRIFVTEIRQTKLRKSDERDALRIFVNPKITWASKKLVKEWEGCGSVAEAGLFAKVARPESVAVEALDGNGERFTLKVNGLLARIVQHEMDHLNGVIFIDRADLSTTMSTSEYLKFKKKLATKKSYHSPKRTALSINSSKKEV